MELDGRKLSWIVIVLGVVIALVGVMVIVANQDVSFTPPKVSGRPVQTPLGPVVGLRQYQTGMGQINTAIENVGRAEARARGGAIIICGVLIAAGGGILRICIKEPPKKP